MPAPTLGELTKAVIVEDQAEAVGALSGRPADEFIPAFEMERGRAGSYKGDPLAVGFGDLAQSLACQAMLSLVRY